VPADHRSFRRGLRREGVRDRLSVLLLWTWSNLLRRMAMSLRLLLPSDER